MAKTIQYPLIKVLLASFLLMTLLGCDAPDNRVNTPDEPVFRYITIQGSYVHPDSNMLFPATVGQFRRTRIRQLSRNSENITVTYQCDYLGFKDAIVSVSLYPYHSANACEYLNAEFDSTKTYLTDIYEMTGLEQGNITIGQPFGPQQGKMLSFKYKDKKEFKDLNCSTSIYLFAHDKWFIKYRFTYPSKNSPKTKEKCDKFLHLLTWPDYKLSRSLSEMGY